jgi:Winged helix DNA-binding domain
MIPTVLPTLSRRQLNRALLARQLLLERASVGLPEALERVGGLQAQYAPSMYIRLWTMLAGFERGALNEALERREVVQATLMRSTIHLVSRADYWPFALAIRRARRGWWTRVHSVTPAAMAGAARTLRRRLDGGVLRAKEVDELLGRERARGVGLWLDLVRVPPSGTWERRRADLLAAAEDWIGPPSVDVRSATEHLVRRYLAGFGPASRNDVASYTGLAPAALSRVLERVAPRRFVSEDGDELYDVDGAPLPDPSVPAPPRFLPTWDATLLVHARRTGVLPEEHRPRIFNTKSPFSFPTFLVDGAVAGTWRDEDGAVRLEPFGRLARAVRRELEEEAERLARFHA